jgi:phytoene dehydrogenase-like protein
MKTYDAIIIGGGHNGLVNAAYLARAGKRVLVLERRELVGGAAMTEEIFPGFKFTVFSYVISLLRPEIIRDLNLPAHGFQILPLPSTFTPLSNGDYIAAWDDHHATRREIYRHSPHDADAYDEYNLLMAQMAQAIRPIMNIVPPNPTSLSPRDLMGMLKFANIFTSLDEKKFYNIYKLMTMSSGDLLDEWFECDPLKGTKSASGIIGTFMGPRTPGSAYVLLHHYMGEIDGAYRAWGMARGGNGAVSASIASAAKALGAEIRTSAPVRQVIVKNGQAVGVALESGEEIYAKVVVSAADPRRTFLHLVEEKELPGDFVGDIKRYKFRGSSGKVNLALDALPNFTAMPGVGPHLRGAISISPSVDYIERAYDEAKRGQFSSKPYIDIIIPSMIDPGMAPPGKHVMSCFVQYAPYNLEGGWTDEKREAFGDTVINTIAEYAPNIKDIIVGRQVIVPPEIERIAGISEGNIFHGELSLQQLFFLRPSPQWSNYRTPIRNYYQCGSGTHPGGGVMGAPGKLAAGEILRDWK